MRRAKIAAADEAALSKMAAKYINLFRQAPESVVYQIEGTVRRTLGEARYIAAQLRELIEVDADTMFRWVMVTPFGKPVVPDV